MFPFPFNLRRVLPPQPTKPMQAENGREKQWEEKVYKESLMKSLPLKDPPLIPETKLLRT